MDETKILNTYQWGDSSRVVSEVWPMVFHVRGKQSIFSLSSYSPDLHTDVGFRVVLVGK